MQALAISQVNYFTYSAVLLGVLIHAMIGMYSLEKLALETASEVHRGQKYGDLDYIIHPLEVASWVSSAGYGPVEQVVALLHDVVEDGELVLRDLLEAGFPPIIVWSVECLSLKEGTREEKVAKACQQPISQVVKLGDSSCNLRHSVLSGHQRRIDRYTANVKDLSHPSIPLPHEVLRFIDLFAMGSETLQRRLGELILYQAQIPNADGLTANIQLTQSALEQRRLADYTLGA